MAIRKNRLSSTQTSKPSTATSPSLSGQNLFEEFPITARAIKKVCMKYAIDKEKIIMTKEKLNKLWRKYEIPKEITFKVPPHGLHVVKKQKGKTIFYINMFTLGVELPLHLEFSNFLRVVKLSPTQLSCNA